MSARPRVSLKLATSLDGRIATAAGESRWITGPAAREEGHRLRAAHAAVLAGVGTALADDPRLDVRLPGWAGAQPAPVILDTRLRLPADGALAQTARARGLIVIAGPAPPAARAAALAAQGATILPVALGPGGSLCVRAALEALAARGVGSVLVEGGGQVAAALLAAGAVDRVFWFRAPVVIGADGRPAVGALALQALHDAPAFRRTAVREIGPDLLEVFEKA